MTTEIDVIKSKSVALRVTNELGLDKDPEFQPHGRFGEFAKWLGFGRADNGIPTAGGTEQEKTARLDETADALLANLQVWSESYIISVAATSQSPITAQRLASTIANDYLATQREARQQALQRVAGWLKSRVDDLRSRLLGADAAIEKLKAESGIRDTGSYNVIAQRIRDLNGELMAAHIQVDEKRAQIEEARRVIDTNGDIQSIPALTASVVLTQLRQQQAVLSWRAAELQNKLGEHHLQVVAIRAQLAGIDEQMKAEAGHILGNMKNAYEIAAHQEQSLAASLDSLENSTTNRKLQQLRRVADADRKLYESYLSQYNETVERRTLQDATARIISPASLPRSSTRSHRKYYAFGAMLGLGSGVVLAFLLEYFRPGVKTGAEIEQSFGRPVVGIIPLVRHGGSRSVPYDRLLRTIVDEPLSQFAKSVRAMRIGLELSSAKPKVILITSALPAEGESTAAMLLAASSAGSGRKTALLDCDLHQQSASEAFRNRRQPGLSDLLRSDAALADVITNDPLTKTYVIPAGSAVPNAADLLMSQRMRELIAALRGEFDYIVLDAPPLLPVIDALTLAAAADKVLVVVEWGHTPRATISEVLKVLRPEAHRVAGIVFNKVDLRQLRGHGYPGYHYRAAGRYFSDA